MIKQTVGILLASALVIAGCGDDKSTPKSAGAAAVEQKTYTWKLVTTWPKNYPGLGTAPEYFAELVARMSNGRIKVKVYGAGQMIPALEVFDAVSQGTAEMGHGPAYYWKGKAPAAVFFTGVPFGLNGQEMNGWLHHGGGMALWREVYAPFNVVPLAGGNSGVQMAGWFTKEIKSLGDIKGLKMRIPGIGGEVITRAGGESVTIPGGELYTALQTGVIDAAEWVGPYNDLTFGFHQVAKYYYYPGWHEPGSTLEFTINKQAWDGLPPDLQAIVEGAARAANQNMLDDYTAHNYAAMVELKEKHGVHILPLPDDVLTELHRISDQVLAELAESDPLAKKVYDSQREFQRQVSAYHEISEEAYYRARRLK